MEEDQKKSWGFASLRFNFSQAFGHCISHYNVQMPCSLHAFTPYVFAFHTTCERTCQSLTVNHVLARVPNAKTAVLIENPVLKDASSKEKKGRHKKQEKRKQPLTQKTTVDRNRKNASRTRRRRETRFSLSPPVVEPLWNEGALFVNSWDSGLRQ